MVKLTLFGALTLDVDGHPRQIPRRKASALLAFLAVTRRSHTREALAALFWPEHSERKGRADLSRILFTLRETLGVEYFVADRQSVAVNEDTSLWVDVVHFRQQLEGCRERALADIDDDCGRRLAIAVDLYQDDFMAGFTLPGCPAFDDWQLLQTESLRRDCGWALDRLVQACEIQNNLAQAVAYAQSRVSLDPLHEPAQRRLIGLYARNGQRAEALRQYQACEHLLELELGVEPQPETKQLYELIRRNQQDSLPLPAFLSEDTEQDAQQTPFVSRVAELASMDEHLQETLNGDGRVLFVTGGAGRGKSSLLQAFVRRAQEKHAGLVAAGGASSFIAGSGDPYLPFREMLDQLTGNVAPWRRGGQMSVEQARRLWALLPSAAQAIVEHGPQLLDVMVSGKQLLARARAAVPQGAGWLDTLQIEVARRQNSPGNLQQAALFGQFTNTLHHLARQQPLLLTLDDLQWIDEDSTGLLFHLGRRLSGSRILIVGAYRPEELLNAQDGESHPLLTVLSELKRTFGDVFIDLAHADQEEGRAFVDAYLDSEPNRLPESFRLALFKQTGGHPLFTVELLRDMQGRGDLVLDRSGEWREGQELEWERLPARVEAVISRRVERLDEATREVLNVASVEGERFTAEVIARVLGLEMRPLLRNLSGQLQNQHRLIRERGELLAGGDALSAYHFSHVLFQQYLYTHLSWGERRHLHGEVAGSLAALFADDLDQVAVHLAHHYGAAGNWDQAVLFSDRAGDLAFQKASLLEAVRHYQAALDHWPERDQKGRAQTLRKLGECLWVLGRHEEATQALQASHELFRSVGDRRGTAATQRLLGRIHWELGQQSKAAQCYQNALTIPEADEDSEEYGWALATMANYQMQIGDYDQSIHHGRKALALARRLNAEALIIQCLCDLGSALSGKGDWEGLELERESLERALATNRAHDAGRAYNYLAEGLFYMGRYEEVRALLNEALAYSQRIVMPFLEAALTLQVVELDWLTGRWSDAVTRAQSMLDHSRTQETAGLARVYLSKVLGRLYNDLGQPKKARERLTEVLGDELDRLDPRLALLGELARAEAFMGRPAQSVAATGEILEWMNQASYLYPNINMALLFICRSPLLLDGQQMVGYARSALQQLQRLDSQYRTPPSAACLLEGQGWLAVAETDLAGALSSFEQAVAQWQSLGHPFDQARALSGLKRALAGSGQIEGARMASKQAMQLVSGLAAQLKDETLRTSFLHSALVEEIRDNG